MELTQLVPKTDGEIIFNNEKYFKFFVWLPIITTVIYAVACFVLGIVFTAIEGAIFLLVFWVGGVIFCLLNYISLKIMFSYKVLHIYYLKKIYLKTTKGAVGNGQKAKMKEQDELPQI